MLETPSILDWGQFLSNSHEKSGGVGGARGGGDSNNSVQPGLSQALGMPVCDAIFVIVYVILIL